MLLTVQLEQWKPSYESQFNEDHHPGGPIAYNNCYTYALASWKHPYTSKPYDQVYVPGAFCGNPLPPYINKSQAKNEVFIRIQGDLMALGYSNNYIISDIKATEMPPEDTIR